MKFVLIINCNSSSNNDDDEEEEEFEQESIQTDWYSHLQWQCYLNLNALKLENVILGTASSTSKRNMPLPALLVAVYPSICQSTSFQK